MKQPAKSTPFVYLCPQCGELLYYRLRARDPHYGAPLRPCPRCGATYFDPSDREPALEKHPRLPLLPGTVWGGLLLGLAFLLGAAFLPQKLELAVMGVQEKHHRQGIGRSLFEQAKKEAARLGYSFLQVKTVQMGKYESYDRTNRFYLSLGFQELEVFPTLWDEWNPCQIYIMALEKRDFS